LEENKDCHQNECIMHFYLNISLKMICNDFLVFKINCLSFAFNIIKQNVDIEEYYKNQKICQKGSKKILVFASDDVITGKH